MIGNDIVDLKHMNNTCHWQRPRFLDKVFTLEEQELISTSENQHAMVWLLWSMKEAAYKLHVQQFGNRFFNPKRLQCQIISEGKGNVSIENQVYVTCSTITDDYVYTVATKDLNEPFNTAVFKSEISTYTVQSDALKQEVLRTISKTKSIPIDTLSIKKNTPGIPKVFYKSEQYSIDMSLTHCGRFSGFAY
ncbi:4'-phosphopantetheinyl transferase superfamily protein [uncultured Psychroserpens sp.]|uniref:4'-phosphopantetheinyl transferase family protein n=1 Tax=uncultured Psychroserpens sp. TaxID=255436 RepID=UPI002620EBCE|nr:4'-phosphopantetheinyl transferase superfamily protein [uncultured Psychroserpens sp.]